MSEVKIPDPQALATQLRGFGPVGLLAIILILAGNLVVLPLSAVLVLAWVRASHTPYTSLGFTTPRSERLGRLLGPGRMAQAAIVPVTATLFALAHYPDQGLPGMEQAAVTGLVFGGIYAVTGQTWLPMIMHAAFDVTAVGLIYRGWETTVAHWFLR